MQQDGCKTRWLQDNNDTLSASSGCVDELTMQLLTLLAINITVGQAQELLLPWVVNKVKRLLRGKTETKLPHWEQEAQKLDFQGTMEEYGELGKKFK